MGDILNLSIKKKESSNSDPNFKKLIYKLEDYLSKTQIESIKLAYQFSKDSHGTQLRKSGEPYINHPISVANILAAMKMDADSIIAAILHDVVEDTHIETSEIKKNFGDDVALIVDGVSKLEHIKFSSKAEAEAENFSKMMIAMSKDLRVMLVKLADRLHNMRTISFLSIDKQKRISKETLEIYVPIAHRLGMNKMRLELEELSFKTLNPRRYQIITENVKEYKKNKRKVVEKTKAKIIERLLENKIIAEVIGREKNPYSIYKKMKYKKLSFKKVYDIFGFRVVTESIDECYQILGRLHNLYKPVPGRFKDYIALPKSNGYQSLHTVLYGPNGIIMEIQIRTTEMDKFAGSGIASHWQYKIGGKFSAQAFAHDWLKSIIDIKKTTSSSFDFLENMKVNLLPDEIYLFTPAGAIKRLPKDSSVIDFAYSVHTDIGNKCVGAKINGVNQPLSTPLSNGQTVEILTSPIGKPNPSWLEYVVTGKARTNIKNYLRDLKEDSAYELGLRIFDQALNDYGTSFIDLKEDEYKKVLSIYGYSNPRQLIINIGLGNVIPHLLARDITEKKNIISSTYNSWLKKVIKSKKQNIPIKGTEGLIVKYANCCHPIPGDDIIGVMSAGNGFVVHRAACKNLKKGLQRINIEWSDKVEGEFLVEIQVISTNERGVLSKVAGVISSFSCNIENVRFNEVEIPYASICFSIKVTSRNHVAEVIKELRKLPDINKVVRT